MRKQEFVELLSRCLYEANRRAAPFPLPEWESLQGFMQDAAKGIAVQLLQDPRIVIRPAGAADQTFQKWLRGRDREEYPEPGDAAGQRDDRHAWETDDLIWDPEPATSSAVPLPSAAADDALGALQCERFRKGDPNEDYDLSDYLKADQVEAQAEDTFEYDQARDRGKI